MKSLSSAKRALLIGSALFCVDRFTKISSLYFFSDRPITLIPNVVQLSLYLHTKFAISADHEVLAVVGGALFVILCIGTVFFLRGKNSSEQLWIALLAAGATSNLLDTIRYGGIIDWIEIPRLTFFNLADVLIISGCVGLLFSLFRKKT